MSLTNLPFIQINNLSATPAFTATTGQTLNVDVTNSTILSGFHAFFASTRGTVSNPTTVNIILHKFAVLGSAPGPSEAILTVDSTSSAFIGALEASQLAAGAATVATGGTLFIDLVDSAVVDLSYCTTAGVTVTLLSVAPEVAYTPSTPSNCSPPPTQVAEALNELAAKSGSSSGKVAILTAQVAVLTAQVAALTASNAQLTAQVNLFTQQQQVLIACKIRLCSRRTLLNVGDTTKRVQRDENKRRRRRPTFHRERVPLVPVASEVPLAKFKLLRELS